MDSTHHLIDALFLAAMKPGSRIVNTARGPVVDEAALVEALKSGHLLSAGLDVHEFEPQVSKKLIGMVRFFPSVAPRAQPADVPLSLTRRSK